MKKSTSSEAPDKFFISIFNHLGAAVPTIEYHGDTSDKDSPWQRNITKIIQPMITNPNAFPRYYDGHAFVFPIYSQEAQAFIMENITPKNSTKGSFTSYKFSELYEELVSISIQTLGSDTVNLILTHGITQAAEIVSILDNIRDLALGTGGKPGVFNSSRKQRKYYLRTAQSIKADLKGAGESHFSIADERTMAKYAYSVVRQVGYKNQTKGGGRAFLNSADVDVTDEESATTSDVSASPPSSISKETCQPPPQTTDSAASSLTPDNASDDMDAFIRLAQSHRVEQIECILKLLSKSEKMDKVQNHPHSTWEMALEYRKSSDLGSQQDDVHNAVVNLSAAAEEHDGSKV